MKAYFEKNDKTMYFNDLKPLFHLRGVICDKSFWICPLMMEFGSVYVESILQDQKSA